MGAGLCWSNIRRKSPEQTGRIKMRVLACAVTAMVLAGAPAAANPEFKLRLGSYAPEGDVIDRSSQHFKEAVARLTNGRVDITLFRSNALGSNREMIEM